jgi:hypothetical protein
MRGTQATTERSSREHTGEFKNYPNNSLRKPALNWREMPSLQAVVLEHFKAKNS